MPNLISAFLVKVLTSQTTINLITDLARELAKRSDNKVDDVADYDTHIIMSFCLS